MSGKHSRWTDIVNCEPSIQFFRKELFFFSVGVGQWSCTTIPQDWVHDSCWLNQGLYYNLSVDYLSGLEQTEWSNLTLPAFPVYGANCRRKQRMNKSITNVEKKLWWYWGSGPNHVEAALHLDFLLRANKSFCLN